MLEFTRLYFEGAACYQSCEVPLKDQGVVAIVGRNGAGKSTIFRVMKDIVFGEVKDAIINRHNPELGYYGELEIRANSVNYRFEESRHHPKYGNGRSTYKNGTDITLKNRTKAQKQVPELLGISREEFENCICLSSLQSSTLLYGLPAQTDNYLSNLFHLYVYDQLLDLIKEDYGAITKWLERKQEKIFRHRENERRLQSLIRPTDEEVAALDLSLREAESRHSKLKSVYKKWVEIIARYEQGRKLREEIEDLGEVTEISESEVAELEQAYRKAERAKGVAAQRARLEEKLRNLGEAGDNRQELSSRLQRADASLQQKTREFEKLEERLQIEKKATLVRDMIKEDGVQEQLDQSAKALTRCEVEIESLQSRYKILQQSDEATCPTCGSVIQDKEGMIEEVSSRKKTFEGKRIQYQKRVEELQGLKSLVDRLASYEEKLQNLPSGDPKEVDKEVTKYTSLVDSLKEQIRTADLKAELEQQLAELPSIKGEVDSEEIRNRLTAARDQREKWKSLCKYRSMLESLPEDAPSAKKLAKLESAIASLDSKILELSSKLELLKRSVSDWNELSQQIESAAPLIKKMNTYKVREVALAGLKSAFSRTGLRQIALRRVLRVITEALPRYVNLLFQESKLKIEMAPDTFDFRIWRSKVEISKKMLSKGESARLALALLLATRQAIPVRKRANILVIDEVLDSLDEEGVPCVFSAFEYLQKVERVGSIFVISPMTKLFQSKSMKSRLDHVWVAAKESNVSHLSIDS